MTIHILKYPISLQNTPIQAKFGINSPFGGFLDTFQADQIKDVLNSEELIIMQTLSDKDEEAKSLAAWVSSHPDITEEEFKIQVEEFSKFMDKHKKENSNKDPL